MLLRISDVCAIVASSSFRKGHEVATDGLTDSDTAFS
jgi:hypothetical protein